MESLAKKIMVRLKYIFLFFFLAIVLSCGAEKERTLSIRIATAANMQFAMQELSQKFTDLTGISCELIVSSSGKLTAQIIEGAPYDMFVSANEKYPQEIFKRGLCLNKPRMYAFGNLVLWSMTNTTPELSLLQSEKIKHIALPNPKVAPYGKAAFEVLKALPYFQILEKKLVFGESISQTNQFIRTQAAEIGFTALSVVLSKSHKNKGKWTLISSKKHLPIAQTAVLLKENEATKKFYRFLFSPEAKKTLKKFGYLTTASEF
jgi:molybdate transport system substrate-binding protein